MTVGGGGSDSGGGSKGGGPVRPPNATVADAGSESVRERLLSIDVEFDEDPGDSNRTIGNVLAMTGETHSLENDVSSLREISRAQQAPPEVRPPPLRAPAVMLPTPFEVGTQRGPGTGPPELPTTSSEPPQSGSRRPPPRLSARGKSGPPPIQKKPPPPPRSIPPKAPSDAPPAKDTAPKDAAQVKDGPPPLSRSAPPPAQKPSARPPPLPRAEEIRPPRVTEEMSQLLELLTARIGLLDGSADRIGLARAHLEISIACEAIGDDARAVAHAETALKIDPALASAHGILRRRSHGRSQLSSMLGHLSHELDHSTTENFGAELVVEKARLLDAMGDHEAAKVAWGHALERSPQHAAAMKGLETELYEATRSETVDAYDDYLTHLAMVADAYASQPSLSAWLHVERATLFDFKLGRTEAARGALERAVRIDPNSKDVRRTYAQFLASHDDLGSLARELEEESRLEKDSVRAASLELEAATICFRKLRDSARAIELLERAAARAPTTPLVDRRVLDDLVRLHEAQGHWADASKARRQRMRFQSDRSLLVHELKVLASISERLGDKERAIEDIERAISIDPKDFFLTDELDRLLASLGKDAERVGLWVATAQRAEQPERRARAMCRAAKLCEERLGRPDEALKHLRAAWVSVPGDPEVADGLSRLMAPRPPESTEREVRALVEVYMQAATAAKDPGRKVAYLEKAATLWEELLVDLPRAQRLYDEILEIEPGRRGAVIGLLRTAGRLGDDRAEAKALLEECKLTEDHATTLALRSRAAEKLAKVDASRALHLVQEVLAMDPSQQDARSLETRLHEEAGRWELVAQSLRARIDHATRKEEKVSLLLTLAGILDTRLRSPHLALEALKGARTLDPVHPVPPEQIARVLEATGDSRALRDAHLGLAADAITPLERSYHWMRAAELDEYVIGDEESASRLYARALAEMPDEHGVAERLDRVLLRRGLKTATRPDGSTRITSLALDERRTFLQKRLERPLPAETVRDLRFQLCRTQYLLGKDTQGTAGQLELLLRDAPDNIPALRLQEAVLRRNHQWTELARILGLQADQFIDLRARLGALWALANLEEWRLNVSDPTGTYARILALDPTDAGALEAIVRGRLTPARRGDRDAREVVIAALRALSSIVRDDAALYALELRTALLVEAHAEEQPEPEPLLRDALERYKTALSIESLSVTAATGLARLATRLDDVASAVTALSSLASLATQPERRSGYLVEAARLLTGPSGDERLGAREVRLRRAADLLESALQSDPNSTEAPKLLLELRAMTGESERLIDAFRVALSQATATPAIIYLGTEIAKVARDDLNDYVLAIDAMRQIQNVAPDHIPSLLLLSELCIAQRAWPEASDTLEEIAAKSKETGPRITALFALASIYDKILHRADDAEKALRRAIELDPENPRAIRAMIHRLAAREKAQGGFEAGTRLEIGALLERLALVETDPATKCDILLELSDIRQSLKDPGLAERALVEAVAHSPTSARAFAKLSRLYRTADGFDAVSYARALQAVIGRGDQLGTKDARWFATLGHIEVESLGRLRDGSAHLRRAVDMEPLLYESRFELADASARMGAHEEAIKTLMAMINPSSRPLLRLADPGAALDLLERALGHERKPEEAIVISELRAITGEIDEGRHAWLRNRKLAPLESHHTPLDRATIRNSIVPEDGRHPLIEVAQAVLGLELRVMRTDPPEMGLSTKDKIGRRTDNVTRKLLDRLARALGLNDIDLIITPRANRARVLAQDTLWLVIPKTIAELPEPTQLAALARALSRIALGFPWLEELPAEHMLGYLIACVRQVLPLYARGDISPAIQKIAAQYEPAVSKEMNKKQRAAIEKFSPELELPAGRPPAVETLVNAVARAELRCAYLLTGDVLATIDELRGLDAGLLHATEAAGREALGAVLDHAFAGDLVRFAMTPECTALRRRVGSTWTG